MKKVTKAAKVKPQGKAIKYEDLKGVSGGQSVLTKTKRADGSQGGD